MSDDEKTPGEEPPKEGAGAAEDQNGEPPVLPADGEESKAQDDKPKDEGAEGKPEGNAAEDAVEEAKKKTLG